MDEPTPRLEKYEIVRPLDSQRWLARRLADGVDVELQWISISSDDVEAIMHFLDRGKMVAELHHPNVCLVLDVDIAGDRSYVASELTPGTDVESLAGSPKLTAAVVAAVAGGCAAALAALHERSIAHGAVRAKNVIVKESGRVVLGGISFGGQPDAAGDLRALGELIVQLHGGERLDEIGARAIAGGFGTAGEIAKAIADAVTPAAAPALAGLAGGRRAGGERLLQLGLVAAIVLIGILIAAVALGRRHSSSPPAPPQQQHVASALPPDAGPAANPVVVALPPDAAPRVVVVTKPDAAPAKHHHHQAATWNPDSPLPPP
jgi:serine/threonine protein kinase